MKTPRKRTLVLALTMAFVFLLAVGAAASAWGGPDNGRGGVAPVAPLTQAEIDAMNMVLQDEYHAWSVYEQIIADFGEIAPFVQIQQAEAQHAAAVERLFDRYDLPLPANEWADVEFDSFESIEAACAAGVEAEIANADLYTQAIANTDKRDLTNVFTNLQRASLESHLPAFEACDMTAPTGVGGPQNSWNQQGNGTQVPYGQNMADCPNPEMAQSQPRFAGRGQWRTQ